MHGGWKEIKFQIVVNKTMLQVYKSSEIEMRVKNSFTRPITYQARQPIKKTDLLDKG